MRWRGTEAIVRRSLSLAASLAGAVLGVAGIACLVVSARVFETDDGFYVTIGSRTIALPDCGMLGDFGTYSAEWGILGLSLLAAATLLIIAPRVRDRLLRGFAVGALALFLVAAATLAQMSGYCRWPAAADWLRRAYYDSGGRFSRMAGPPNASVGRLARTHATNSLLSEFTPWTPTSTG